MANLEQKILISRSKYIEDNVTAAEIRLKEQYTFMKGEVVMLKYHKDNPDFRGDIGVLLAIGIKDGKGEDCYKILSLGGNVRVGKVVTEPPDIAELVSGHQLYIYHNLEDNKWYYAYPVGTGTQTYREYREIEGGPFIFLEVSTGYRWFYDNQTCKREDEFFTTDELTTILSDLEKSEVSVIITTENNILDPDTPSGTSTSVSISAIDNNGHKVDGCTFYYNGEIIEDPDNFSIPTPTRDTRVIFEAVVDIDGISVTYEGFIDFYIGKKIFVGIVDAGWENVSSNISKIPTRVEDESIPLQANRFHKKIVRAGDNIMWNDINMTNLRTVVAYPEEGFGPVLHIYDHSGIDYIDDYVILGDKRLQTIEEEYYVCVKEEPVTVKKFLQDFWFSDKGSKETEDGTGYGDISDLINAWKGRGSGNSILVLNDEGRIDPKYYDANVSAGFTEIEEITNGFLPNTEVGKLYYNTETRQLYEGTATGYSIRNGERGIIYSCRGDFYIWDNEEGLLVFSSNIQSQKIENTENLASTILDE